jgi:hypothetical protein
VVEAVPLSRVHPVGKPLEFTVSKLGLVSRPAGQKLIGVAVGVAVAVGHVLISTACDVVALSPLPNKIMAIASNVNPMVRLAKT